MHLPVVFPVLKDSHRQVLVSGDDRQVELSRIAAYQDNVSPLRGLNAISSASGRLSPLGITGGLKTGVSSAPRTKVPVVNVSARTWVDHPVQRQRQMRRQIFQEIHRASISTGKILGSPDGPDIAVGSESHGSRENISAALSTQSGYDASRSNSSTASSRGEEHVRGAMKEEDNLIEVEETEVAKAIIEEDLISFD
jgi:hypothetical protein